MNEYRQNELKTLLSESMREKQDSYLIEQLMTHFPTAQELTQATEQELIRIKGMGIGKSKQLMALLKLSKALAVPATDRYVVKSPQDVFDLLEPDFRHLQKEHFVCLFLNTKNHVIFKEIISIGSLNAAIVHPREVFRAAIKRSSASIICAHNHPSGDPTPSTEDIELTKRIVDAGNLVGIDVLDHIIIGDHHFYSLREKGHM